MNVMVKQVALVPGDGRVAISFDLSKLVYAIIITIDCDDIEGIENCENWLRQRQFASQAAKEMRRYILSFLRCHQNYRAITNPVSLGIDINETLSRSGIQIGSPSYQIAFLGVRKKELSKKGINRPKLKKN